MTQRTALVTGSAQGIGRAVAEALAKSGHNVIGVDILGQEPMGEVVEVGKRVDKLNSVISTPA